MWRETNTDYKVWEVPAAKAVCRVIMSAVFVGFPARGQLPVAEEGLTLFRELQCYPQAELSSLLSNRAREPGPGLSPTQNYQQMPVKSYIIIISAS